MGCSESKNVDALEFLRKRYPKTLSILELQGQSKALADLFIEHDRNGNQTLGMGEFVAMCKLSRNRVSKRLFDLCDMDGNGALDFREACFAVWQLCTLDDRGLTQMLFDLYDEYQNGAVEVDDMERLLGDCYGTGNLSNEDMQAMLKEVEEAKHLGREDFVAFCGRAPQVLKQIVDAQRSMRANVLGTAYWERAMEKRMQKTDPVFRPENWNLLMERIILMDIESRAETVRLQQEAERRAGRRLRHVDVKARHFEEKGLAGFRYEP